MTLADTAHRAAQSDLFKKLTQVGFIGYGLLHLAFAWVAAQIAFGEDWQEGDQSGAFQKLAEQPFGKVLLWFVLICLIALALWRAALAIWGHRDVRGKERIWERIASAARVVIYTALAWTAGIVGILLLQAAVTSDPGKSRGLDAAPHTLAAQPDGKFLLLAVALGVAAFGAYCFFQARYRKVGT